MSTLDNILTESYKNMIGVVDIYNLSGDSIFKESLTLNSYLYVSGITNFNKDITMNTSLCISGTSNLQGNITTLNNLNVINTSLLISNITLMSNINVLNTMNSNNKLSVFGNSIMNYVSMNSNLVISGSSIFNESINTSYINNNNNITFDSNNIYIGNPTSIVNIMGNVNYIESNELKIIDKVLSLNLNLQNLSPTDNGYYSGIEIIGTGGTGFIRTALNPTRYEIKAPQELQTNYLLTLDSNNLLNVSGTAILRNNVSLLSNINVSGVALIPNMTINKNLNVSGYTIINNNVSCTNSLNVSGNSLFINMITMNSKLNTIGYSILNNISEFSTLNVSGNSLLMNYTLLNNKLNISGDTIFANNTTLLNSFNISGNTIFQGYTSLLTNLILSGNSNLVNNTSINTNLYISGYTNMLGSTSIRSSLFISSNTILNSNVTINSKLNIKGKKNIITKNYQNNLSAKNDGVPIWGWYRTGGVLKIRLEDIPPTILLFGSSTTVTASSSMPYVEMGGKVNDNMDPSISMTLYIKSILFNGTTELLTNKILTSDIYSYINYVPGTYYIVTYTASDSSGNSSSITRTIQIV